MAQIQQTLASQGSFKKFGRKSKRELFLEQMNQVVPWADLLALVEGLRESASRTSDSERENTSPTGRRAQTRATGQPRRAVMPIRYQS